jgi:hypothetical protein
MVVVAEAVVLPQEMAQFVLLEQEQLIKAMRGVQDSIKLQLAKAVEAEAELLQLVCKEFLLLEQVELEARVYLLISQLLLSQEVVAVELQEMVMGQAVQEVEVQVEMEQEHKLMDDLVQQIQVVAVALLEEVMLGVLEVQA